jgi:hypothetical protein
MVDLSEIQAAYYMVAATGVLVAAAYYIQNIRINEKIRRRDQVFQKLQVNMLQHNNVLYEVMNMTDWKTLEELTLKYGRRTNPEAFAKRSYILNHYNCLGILLKDGLVDEDELFQLYPPNTTVALYSEFELWIKTQRMHSDGKPSFPEAYRGFEYLADVARKRYPNLLPLRMWTGVQPSDDAGAWGRKWDEYFAKNPPS